MSVAVFQLQSGQDHVRQAFFLLRYPLVHGREYKITVLTDILSFLFIIILMKPLGTAVCNAQLFLVNGLHQTVQSHIFPVHNNFHIFHPGTERLRKRNGICRHIRPQINGHLIPDLRIIRIKRCQIPFTVPAQSQKTGIALLPVALGILLKQLQLEAQFRIISADTAPHPHFCLRGYHFSIVLRPAVHVDMDNGILPVRLVRKRNVQHRRSGKHHLIFPKYLIIVNVERKAFPCLHRPGQRFFIRRKIRKYHLLLPARGFYLKICCPGHFPGKHRHIKGSLIRTIRELLFFPIKLP